MVNTLLNISGKLSPFEVEVFDSVHQVASQLGISFLVVGASARDLILHHAHGIEIIRATGDIDFAIQVKSWNDFLTLKSRLLDMGFAESGQKQRLVSPVGIPVDIVPFGAIEDERARIRWLPEEIIEMHVLGFREACEHADIVRIRNHPPLDIPIVTMAGLSVLKIIAWTDRTADIRKKDSIDLLYLLKNYERIPLVIEAVYEADGLLERYGWDTTLAGAHLLGADAAKIILPQTLAYITVFQVGEMVPLGIERLVEDMSNDDDQFERNQSLLTAYFSGLKKQALT